METRKAKITNAPKSILKESTNIQSLHAPLLTHISETRPGKENSSEFDLPNQAITEQASLIHLDSIFSLHLELPNNENEFPQHPPNIPEHPPREDPMCDSSLVRTLFRDSEPPDSQVGDGDSCMGGLESEGARVDYNSQNPQ